MLLYIIHWLQLCLRILKSDDWPHLCFDSGNKYRCCIFPPIQQTSLAASILRMMSTSGVNILSGTPARIPVQFTRKCLKLLLMNKGEKGVFCDDSYCVQGVTLQWRQNGHDSVSNHQPRDCLLNRLFRRRLKKTSKLRVTGLCVGNSPGTGEFPAQMASNAENVSIWWRHHDEEFPGTCIHCRQLLSTGSLETNSHESSIKISIFRSLNAFRCIQNC